MKLAYKNFSTILEIEQEHVGSLIIENPSVLYTFLIELKDAAYGIETGVVLSENNKLLDISKNAELITDFIQFDLNQKNLITKIISCLSKISEDESHYNETQQLLARIEDYIMDMTTELSCDLTCDKLNMQSLLKGVGIAIEDNYSCLEERLLAYMDLARDFLGKRLFILINVRSIISTEHLQVFADAACTGEHTVLFVDNKEYPRLRQETRLIIDEDMCEI